VSTRQQQQEFALRHHMTTVCARDSRSPIDALGMYAGWPTSKEFDKAIKEAAKRDVKRGVRTVVG